MLSRFWAWYERHYALNVALAAGLFTLQLIHLVWLTFDPLWGRLFGDPAVAIEKPWNWPLLLVDYTEIPALVSVSLVYVNELRKRTNVVSSALYLVFLNSQWLHIFWITDEFVVESRDGGTALPVWLAYIAILIDYLELPVIVDTFRKLGAAVKDRRLSDLAPDDA
jgi:hypothetical protein